MIIVSIFDSEKFETNWQLEYEISENKFGNKIIKLCFEDNRFEPIKRWEILNEVRCCARAWHMCRNFHL